MICIVSELEEALKTGDVNRGISSLRAWLSTCQLGEPIRLLDACSVQMRPNVTLLMGDLLSQFPKLLLGCPLLLCGTKAMDSDPLVLTHGMVLPFPRPENAKPCSELFFIGWLPSDIQLPVYMPFRQKEYKNMIDWCTPTAYVALFLLQSEDLDLDEIAVPLEWWGDLFINGSRNDEVADVRIEGNLLLGYPDALEIAAAMRAGARGYCPPTFGPFQGDTNWAYQLGVNFQQNCLNQFIREKP